MHYFAYTFTDSELLFVLPQLVERSLQLFAPELVLLREILLSLPDLFSDSCLNATSFAFRELQLQVPCRSEVIRMSMTLQDLVHLVPLFPNERQETVGRFSRDRLRRRVVVECRVDDDAVFRGWTDDDVSPGRGWSVPEDVGVWGERVGSRGGERADVGSEGHSGGDYRYSRVV